LKYGTIEIRKYIHTTSAEESEEYLILKPYNI